MFVSNDFEVFFKNKVYCSLSDYTHIHVDCREFGHFKRVQRKKITQDAIVQLTTTFTIFWCIILVMCMHRVLFILASDDATYSTLYPFSLTVWYKPFPYTVINSL